MVPGGCAIEIVAFEEAGDGVGDELLEDGEDGLAAVVVVELDPPLEDPRLENAVATSEDER